MSKLIYLDHAAATPMDAAVLAAMQPYFKETFFNPSATYLASKKVADDVKAARSQVGLQLGAKPAEIIFTAGGTEANNLALFGIIEKYPGSEIVSSAIEHESILAPIAKLAQKGHKNRLVQPRKDGVIDPNAVSKAINDKTVLVSIMYANNEIGTIQPLRQIAQELEKIRAQRRKKGINLPLYFHTDACQAGNYLSLQVHRLGVDMLTLNAGKIYGPKQCGALYVSGKIDLEPQVLGGGQERGLRSGTENVANIIGLAKALDLAQSKRESEVKRLRGLQNLFVSLVEQKLPGAKINGSVKHRLPNNVHLTFTGADNERVMMQLEERGILCGLGSACSASSQEPSHVLAAIGLTEGEARASLRFTMGRATTENDVKTTVKALAALTPIRYT